MHKELRSVLRTLNGAHAEQIGASISIPRWRVEEMVRQLDAHAEHIRSLSAALTRASEV